MLRLSRDAVSQQDARTHVPAVLEHVPERWRGHPGASPRSCPCRSTSAPECPDSRAAADVVGGGAAGAGTPAARDRIVQAILLFDKSGGKTLPGLTARAATSAICS